MTTSWGWTVIVKVDGMRPSLLVLLKAYHEGLGAIAFSWDLFQKLSNEFMALLMSLCAEFDAPRCGTQELARDEAG